MTRRCSIYGLYLEEDGVVRYIGQTIQLPFERRLSQHIADAKRGRIDSRLFRWIRKSLSNRKVISIKLLEADCIVDEAERRWISEYRQTHGDVLVNGTDGGEHGSPGNRSEHTKAKMSGPKTEAHRRAMRKPKSETHKTNISLALVGNSRSRGAANRKAVLDEDMVVIIKNRIASGEGVSVIARKVGLQKSAISKIKTGRNWSHVAI